MAKTVREKLVERVAEQMELPVEFVNSVVSFQGEDAAKAARIYNEIEFSGWGKFWLSKTKTRRKIVNMEKKLEEGRVKEDVESYKKHLEELKNKLGE